MTQIDVPYYLTDEQIRRGERIAERWGSESVGACFRFLMLWGSQQTIDIQLDRAERLDPMLSVLRQTPVERDEDRRPSDQ